MDRAEIEQKVIEIAGVQFGMKLDEINLETKFITDLGADSLDTIEIIMMGEDIFDIVISNEDAEKIMDVGMLADYVEKVLADDSSK